MKTTKTEFHDTFKAKTKNVIYCIMEGDNMTQSQIGKALGVPCYVIGCIIKGTRTITVEQATKLMTSFRVNMNYLFGRSDEMFMNEDLTLQSKLNDKQNDTTRKND